MKLDSVWFKTAMSPPPSDGDVPQSDAALWGTLSPLCNLGKWLRVTKVVFLIFGTLALIYCGLVLVDAAVFQMRARQELKDLQTRLAGRNSAPLAPGSVLASMDSPRIGLSAMVLEGTDKRTLGRGLGHLSGTGLIGEAGNVVIAGHRDTFFRPLQNLRVGDDIVLTAPVGSYRYQVIWTQAVKPTETAALQPTQQPVLTLVTCYPFSYVGPAPERMLVRAVLMETKVP